MIAHQPDYVTRTEAEQFVKAAVVGAYRGGGEPAGEIPTEAGEIPEDIP
jgi:hypothetical protein